MLVAVFVGLLGFLNFFFPEALQAEACFTAGLARMHLI